MAMKPRQIITGIFRRGGQAEQNTNPTTTLTSLNPPIAVRSRSGLVRDKKSGKYYQAETQEVNSRGAQDVVRKSKWVTFKDTCYDTTDRIGSIARRISRRKKLPSIDVETSYSNGSELTPREKVLQQYELRSVKDEEVMEQDLYRTDRRKAFDSAKDRVFDSIKAISSKDSKVSSSLSSQMPQSSNFKVVSKVSTNKELEQYAELVQDLTSEDPTQKLKASVSMVISDYERQRRELDEQRRQIITFCKDIIYNTFDSIQMVFKAVLGVPQQIQSTAEVTTKSVREAVDAVKDNIEETQKITKEVVEDIQSIPANVEKRISDTKTSIRETKEGIEQFSKRVNDLAYDAKVLVGLEEYKPTPPPPPKQKTGSEIASEIATDIAGTVATEGTKLVGKAAWFTVRKGLGLGFAGVKAGTKLAWDSVTRPKSKSKTESITTAVANEKTLKPKLATVAIPSSSEIPKVVSGDTLDEIDPTLALEISNALKLAEDALADAEKERDNGKTIQGTDIDEAVRRAKEAAAAAAADAAELELLFSRRKKM